MVHKYHYEYRKMTFTGEQTADTNDFFSTVAFTEACDTSEL